MLIFAVGILPSLTVMLTSAYLLNSTLKHVGASGLEQTVELAGGVVEQTQAAIGNLLKERLRSTEHWKDEAALRAWVDENGLDFAYVWRNQRALAVFSDSLASEAETLKKSLPLKPGLGHLEGRGVFILVFSERDSSLARGCGVLLPAAYVASGQKLTRRISAAASLGIYRAFSLKLLTAVTLIAILFSVTVGLVLSALLSRQLAKPLERLVADVGVIASGNYDHRVMMAGENEFSRLAEAFNSMSAAIKENQSRLLRAERLAAWREVARRIAHEIRNPLTPIGVELYRLSKMMEERPSDFAARAASALDVIKGQMTILQDLALQFSMFAREPELRLEKCSLKEIVKRTLGMFESFENLRLEIDIPDDLPFAYLDPQMMTRVFVNLIKNSAEAVEGIVLVSISAGLKDDSLAVVVKDNGPGFPQAKLDDIGQPYITSKKTGTGLGLAVAKKIIDEHRGTIKIYNDHGAVVDIRLPLEIPK